MFCKHGHVPKEVSAVIPRPMCSRGWPSHERPLPEGQSYPPLWPRNARCQDASAKPQPRVLYRWLSFTDGQTLWQTDRPLPHLQTHPYPAVLVDGLQPLHSYVPDVASPEEDFAWKRHTLVSWLILGKAAMGPEPPTLIPLSLSFSAF